MLAYNPFAQRNFTTSNVTAYSHDRRYFPNMPINATRPGFLIATQESFPKVTSDMRSPYFKLSSREPQPRTRNKYVQNPFHKSHLLEDSDYMTGSARLYTSDVPSYSSRYGGYLSQSAVTPVETDTNYRAYPSANGKYDELAYSPKEVSKKQSRDKYPTDSLNKKNSQSSGNLNKKNSYGSGGAYDSYDNRPIISQVDNNSYQTRQSGGLDRKTSSKNSNPEQNAYDSELKQGLLKKMSSSQYKNQRMQSNESAIRKFDNISERPSYEEDDPLNYNYPSFNMKGKINKKESIQQIQSPSWPGNYRPLNEERDNERGNNRANDRGYGKGYDESAFTKQNENRGVQAVNSKMPNAPSTITYNGRMFYLVNLDDEL